MSTRRVLIIEDERDSAEFASTFLTLRGYAVAIAEDGCEGLETARVFQPDVIVCDIRLRGDMSGFDVARALRSDERFRSTLLIACTGYGDSRDKDMTKEAGFDAHITKPVDLSQLLQLVGQSSAT